MPAAYEVTSPICQQLVDLEMLDIDQLKIDIDTISRMESNNGRLRFSLFVEEQATDTLELNYVCGCLYLLRNLLINEGLIEVSIGKMGEGLDNLQRMLIKAMLPNRLSTNNLRITICTREVRTPPENDTL